jgi:SAM-dependent methyltransferase
MSLRDAWEGEAESWVRFARNPEHDFFFWLHGLPNMLALLPPPGRCTLDVGCGEGRLPRELTARGHQVVGIDGSPSMARYAASHEQGTAVAVGDAARLPVADAAADLVVASMSLMDVDDLGGAVREIARVLSPGGRLCASVVHPINSAGAFTSDAADSPFVLDESYLESRRYSDELTRDDVTVTFHSLHHSVEGYLRAIEDAGLLVEAVREPPASDELVAAAQVGARWKRVPVFLYVRAIKF